ncbi:hypothetical protein FNV43_RR06338 [Rhamnella rubrinervis]|uniref:Protein kinase domain-containing protein n=1 Tax=Rhamnella rubrinervis TaxID=2594499 RepID=A0A8K0HDQ7_9ROSA|nr:hypothetical protein FNV43_RR06338 [Rhamnella rubrinervis]
MELLRMVSQGILLEQFSLAVVFILAVLAAATAGQQSDWSKRCGDVDVPFPFGMDDKTYLDDTFLITCSTSFNPPKAFLRNTSFEVTNISVDEGELSVMQSIAKDCYNELGIRDETKSYYFYVWFTVNTVSSTKNKFFAIGCDTNGYVEARVGERYSTGCISYCGNKTTSFISESCSGAGCCEAPIADGLKNFSLVALSYYNHSGILESNPCSYAFVTDETKFKSSTNTSFKDLDSIEKLPMVINWAIGNESVRCDDAQKRNNYVCKKNSECVDVHDGSGDYRCRCLTGFEGNPYYQHGCRDIDECKLPANPCSPGVCENLQGTWKCKSCPKGYTNNGTACNERSIIPGDRSRKVLFITLGASIALLVVISIFCWGMKKRKVSKLKKKFFEQNGGLALQQKLYSSSGRRQSHGTTQIFSEEELKKATNNYHASRVVGEGGCGIVYKGTLPNNKVVAIKKSKFGAHKVNEQFINEVVMLLQINHRNVVKLLGCCLETEVPLLVSEFISNGTVFEHIHNKGEGYSPLPWELRLKIATDTAGALAYLHSATSTPIIHRDVKTGNILLDESFTAKVSDFGASRLIPLDQTRLSTVVQGTLGYLDPEYMETSQLTEKSDVYSFGVVLAELLTGKKALCLHRSENERNLAKFFVSFMKDDRLLEIIDDDIIIEGNVEELKYVASIAKRCLHIKSQERPNMREVAMELEGVLRNYMEIHEWGNVDGYTDETECLFTRESSDLYAIDVN